MKVRINSRVRVIVRVMGMIRVKVKMMINQCTLIYHVTNFNTFFR